MRKREILPFATTWLDPEDFILNDMSGRERQILYDLTYKGNLKKAPNS